RYLARSCLAFSASFRTVSFMQAPPCASVADGAGRPRRAARAAPFRSPACSPLRPLRQARETAARQTRQLGAAQTGKSAGQTAGKSAGQAAEPLAEARRFRLLLQRFELFGVH